MLKDIKMDLNRVIRKVDNIDMILLCNDIYISIYSTKLQVFINSIVKIVIDYLFYLSAQLKSYDYVIL